MDLIRRFFRYDAVHARVDLVQWATYLLLAIETIAWAITDHGDTKYKIGRWIVLAIFAILIRFIMAHIGDSRFSTVIAATVALILFRRYNVYALAELNTFLLLAMVTVEYFKQRTKLMAVVSAAVVGVLAAGETVHGHAMLTLFITAVFARLLWHALFERLTKLALLLFGLKAIMATAITIVVYMLLRDHLAFTWVQHNGQTLPTLSQQPWWLVVVGLLVVLRGIWATVLLQTLRSPLMRGLRMYLAVWAVVSVLAIGLLRHFADRTFLPDVTQKLRVEGLLNYSPEILIFVVVAILGVVGAAIDRSLYKDTGLGRYIRARLA